MYKIGTAIEILGNAFIAAIIAQLIKLVWYLIIHKKLNFKNNLEKRNRVSDVLHKRPQSAKSRCHAV